MTQLRSKSIALATILLLGLAGADHAWARGFRVNQYPNGTALNCAACHLNPAGGGTRTPFGNRVFQIIGGSEENIPFWSPALAAEDSDGDTYCNGQEVRDPDGDGIPSSAVGVTNPGAGTSRPANSAPTFTSTPPLQATMGLAYQYPAAATDVDGCQQWTFSKAAGPDWLTVATNGLVAGTPPDSIGGEVSVTVLVQDNGAPISRITDQTYALSVIASYPGWQALKFDLPAEAGLAEPQLDAEGDGIINALEYAYRTNPRTSNTVESPVAVFTGDGQMTISLGLRDDDPGLSARMEVSDTVLFDPITSVPGTVADPVPGDGQETWTFVDPVSSTNVQARFGRIRIEY